MMKRWIALFLAMMMMLTVAVSCGKGGEEPAETTVQTTTAATTAADVVTEAPVETNKYEIGNELPENLNYGGAEIHFLSRGRAWCKDVIDVDDLTGEVINDAVYTRNAAVEDLLNVKIVDHKAPTATDDYEIVNLMKIQVPAGASDYDVVCGATYTLLKGAAENLFQNYLEMEYIDLSRPYWSQGINEAVSVGEGQYLATGAICLSYYRFIFANFFNKNMFDEHNIPYLYEAVENGTWTLDYQNELATGFYADLNGNNTADENDRFGFILNHNCIGVDTYWASFELPILSKDENNFFVFSPDKERLATAVEKINDIVWNNEGTWHIANKTADGEQEDLARMFGEDRAAMVTLRLIEVESLSLRNMESKYGIVPVPKLDEAQTEYHSHIHDNTDGFCVPLTTYGDELDMVGAVLEAMASEGYRTLMPAYYETALKTKYVSDEASVQMLDLVIDSLRVDSGFLFVDGTNGFHQNMRTWVDKNYNNISSALSAVDRIINKQVEKLNAAFEGIQ